MLSKMPRKKSEYAPGENPRSQENLQPRKAMYDEPKKRRQLMATDEGWNGFKQVAKAMDLSASELVEQIGRGLVELGRQ